jgi:hypothetical protein
LLAGKGAVITGGGAVSMGPSICGGRFATTPQPPGPHGGAHGAAVVSQPQQSPATVVLPWCRERPNIPPLESEPNMEHPVVANKLAATVSEAKRVTILPSFCLICVSSGVRRGAQVSWNQASPGKAQPCTKIMRQDASASKPTFNKTERFFAAR